MFFTSTPLHFNNSTVHQYLLLIGFLLSMTSCNKKEDNAGNAAPYQESMNVAYGKDTAQKMDIYLPANRTSDNTKVIILIHGGAWMEGDKKDFSSYISLVKNRLPDYAIINVNYRLATQTNNYFPTQENDIAAAVSFIHDREKEYKISSKYVLLGASAGAHLALLQAYKYKSPVAIKAVVSFFGPTDLIALYNNQTSSYYQLALQTLIGGTPQSNLSVYQQSSPIFFASAQSCPTLLLHGGKDPVVAPAQSEILKSKLIAAGVATDLVIYPNEGHGWYGANLDDSFDRIKKFLEVNVP